jgi:hypothetical protein
MNFIYTLFGFRTAESKRQRWLVILVHCLGWLTFFSLPILFFNIEITNKNFLLKECINKLFLVAFFYFNYYFLLPNFFLKGKRRMYFLLVIICFLFLMVQQVVAERYLLSKMLFYSGTVPPPAGPGMRIIQRGGPDSQPFTIAFAGPPDTAMLRNRGGHFRSIRGGAVGVGFMPMMFYIRTLTGLLSNVFVMLLLGGFIYLAFSFFKSQSEKKLLENANLTAENNLLKSQINPHFLFNTLNSIYALALQKSDRTELSIMKLSEILRYMVYETGSEKILLEKDIYYISSYIELQRLRLSSRVPIDYEVKGNLNHVYISPLILITFVENAFKHGISFTKGQGIGILIEVIDKTLTLRVHNPVAKTGLHGAGGIGQKNAKRRLDLLYPGKYWLNIATENETYVVTLKMDLHQ